MVRDFLVRERSKVFEELTLLSFFLVQPCAGNLGQTCGGKS